MTCGKLRGFFWSLLIEEVVWFHWFPKSTTCSFLRQGIGKFEQCINRVANPMVEVHPLYPVVFQSGWELDRWSQRRPMCCRSHTSPTSCRYNCCKIWLSQHIIWNRWIKAEASIHLWLFLFQSSTKSLKIPILWLDSQKTYYIIAILSLCVIF